MNNETGSPTTQINSPAEENRQNMNNSNQILQKNITLNVNHTQSQNDLNSVSKEQLIELHIRLSNPQQKTNIPKFNGSHFNVFKDDIERNLLASNRLQYVTTPPSNHTFDANIDMQVQLFITNSCIRQIKQNLQLTKNESAYSMWSYLNQVSK